MDYTGSYNPCYQQIGNPRNELACEVLALKENVHLIYIQINIIIYININILYCLQKKRQQAQ